jgi:preprotein translocase subunit SecD
VAPPVGTLRVGRYFLALFSIFVLLYLIVFWPGARHTPKLGLDLKGGTQVIFTAKTTNGKTPSSSSMSEAKQILTDRVNGTGVTEATVVIQGSDQLVVSIPGSTDTDVRKLGAAAALNFRGLVAPPVQEACVPLSVKPSTSGSTTPSTTPSTSPSTTPSTSSSTPVSKPTASTTVHDAGSRRLTPLGNRNAAPTTTPSTTPKATSTPTTSPTPTTSSSAPATPQCSATPFAALEKAGLKVPLTDTTFEALPTNEKSAISATLANFDCASGQDEKDVAKSYFIACDSTGLVHLLGPVIVAGKQVSTAAAVAPNISGGQTEWTVSLDLKSSGQSAWAKYTAAHNVGGVAPTSPITSCGSTGTPCADYVAFTLDGVIISAPYNNSAINGGKTQITGNFKQKSAKTLANQLKYGALPLTFKAEQAQTISATLGTSQLKSGMLAGGIGLVLVVIYSLLYYRALGLVTIASLLVSGGLTYGSLVMLATQIGFTLSLAGIAGFIVAIGITADSFVVFFERIKDEVHDGRSVRVAIPRAWTRARRTILSADTVSFLAAAILYYFAAGDVKGFAFTLGLSTILDLVVVFLFTHPLVSWLSRKKAFGSARFTGLNAVREGGIALYDKLDKPDRSAKSEKAAAPEPRVSAGTIKIEKSSIAVLEMQEDIDDEVDEDSVDDAADAVEDEADTETVSVDEAVAETDIADDAEADDEAATERKRTKPAPGSAAERAAARRARLRERGES